MGSLPSLLQKLQSRFALLRVTVGDGLTMQTGQTPESGETREPSRQRSVSDEFLFVSFDGGSPWV